MVLERNYQAGLIRELKVMFPGCIIIKMPSDYLQGFPDLLILFGDRWAALEVKASARSPYQPNQEYYLQKCAEMSFSATICPENEEDVLRELEQALTQPRR